MSKTPQYPRGVPFKPPESAPGGASSSGEASALKTPADANGALDSDAKAAVRRESQLRRWMLMLALTTVGIVILAVGVGVFAVTLALRRLEAPAVAAKAPASAGKVVGLRNDDEQPPRPTKSAKEPAAVARPAPHDPPAAAPATPQPEPAPAVDKSLEAVGGLSAAHLYQTYLNLGMLADATENDVYSESEAKKLLTTIGALMDKVDKQLARVAESATDAEDKKKLDQVRELTALLRTQARELRAYWDTPEKDTAGKKEHETKFHKAREDVWAGIKELLNIKDEQ